MHAIRCSRCGLPRTYPGIKFNKENLCNYCVYYELYKDREKIIKSELQKGFRQLINNVKKRKYKYDCVVAYSGGKDSSFLLYFLKKEFKLNIMAHTLDNGFISAEALKNIERISHRLGIDYRITRPDFEVMKQVFTYALTESIPYPKEILAMMSQVCAVCIGMVFGTTLNTAIELKAPLMFLGFTPGQYPAISLENFLKIQSCVFLSHKVYRDDPMDIIKIIADPIRSKFGSAVRKYFLKSQYLPKGLTTPKILFPYHALLEYDEKEIIKAISQLGWVKSDDTDACSTNCLLNSLANYTFLKQLSYHPYIGELSYLAREGRLNRREAIQNTFIDEDSFAIRHCLERLGLEKLQL